MANPTRIGSVFLEVETSAQGLQARDPRLYQTIQLLNKQIEELTVALSPLIIISTLPTTGISTLRFPGSFQAASTGVSVRFTWVAVSGAAQYEIRRNNGVSDNWDTATFITKVSTLQADIDPLLYGSYRYLIKSIDAAGAYSVLFGALTFVVPQIPAVTIITQIIDNNVLLRWDTPISTFNIAYYIVYKNGVEVGRIFSTFTILFEVIAGTYTYSIKSVDVAGNIGTEAFSTVIVNTPPDYALQDHRVSTLNGTRVDVIKTSNVPVSLVACWATTTFENHFIPHGWLPLQDQVTAGYPIYIQPAALTGSYEEVVDYGAIINNLIAVITYNVNIITPAAAVGIIVKMAVSNDNISYSAFVSGASQFYSQFRYLKFRLEFTGVSDKALIELYNLTIDVNVKRENDGGEIAALLTDALGTEVFFNKPFKDVESITVSVKSTTEPYRAIFSFVDVPNPVSFFVFAFDTTGNRVSKTVDWKARGIV